MQSIEELAKRLEQYRGGRGDLPTYMDLAELVAANVPFQLIGYAKQEFIDLSNIGADQSFFGISKQKDEWYQVPIFMRAI